MKEPADTDAVAHVFIPALDERVDVRGPDGHHLVRVRRLTSGESVTGADGSGAWRLYEVTAVAGAVLTLAAKSDVVVAPEPLVKVSLAVALTKGGLDDVVAATTELGVESVTPVRTQRCVVKWDAPKAERVIERLQTVAREASAQSRRPRIPTIGPVVDLTALRDRPGLVVADRGGRRAVDLDVPSDSGWTVLVGPEGGLAPDELELLGEAPRLTLGPNVLRAVTAPIAAVAALTGLGVRLRPE